MTFEEKEQPEQASIVKLTLSEQIYERLKADIINHRIGFGEKLVNRELQQIFGVSSTPVRDAINHLYVDGLLENITNGGARVISFDVSLALEVNEVVKILSQGALTSLAKRGKLGELYPVLNRLLQQQEKVKTMDDYIVLDRQFHQAVFDACGNRHLSATYRRYTVLFEMLVRMSRSGRADFRDSTEEHRKICDCCRREDFPGLIREIELHYQSASDWFIKNASLFEA